MIKLATVAALAAGLTFGSSAAIAVPGVTTGDVVTIQSDALLTGHSGCEFNRYTKYRTVGSGNVRNYHDNILRKRVNLPYYHTVRSSSRGPAYLSAATSGRFDGRGTGKWCSRG